MRRSAAVFALAIPLAAAPAQQAPRPNLQPVPFPQVRIDDPFFAPRRATNRSITLEHALAQLEASGTLANFDLAAAGRHEGFQARWR